SWHRSSPPRWVKMFLGTEILAEDGAPVALSRHGLLTQRNNPHESTSHQEIRSTICQYVFYILCIFWIVLRRCFHQYHIALPYSLQNKHPSSEARGGLQLFIFYRVNLHIMVFFLPVIERRFALFDGPI